MGANEIAREEIRDVESARQMRMCTRVCSISSSVQWWKRQQRPQRSANAKGKPNSPTIEWTCGP